MFKDFKFERKQDSMISIRISKKDKDFMKKRKLSPTMLFRSKLEEFKRREKKWNKKN